MPSQELPKKGGRDRRLLRRDDVRQQPFLAAGSCGTSNDCPSHPGVLRECRLDFGRLDPLTQDLDLIVEPAQKFDVAVGEEPHQIAGPVEACAGYRLRRIPNELLSRELRMVQIPARQPVAADAELTGRAASTGRRSSSTIRTVVLEIGRPIGIVVPARKPLDML